MRSYVQITRAAVALALVLVPRLPAAEDPDRDFTGVWILDEKQSDFRGLPTAPAPVLNITLPPAAIQCVESGPDGQAARTWVYPTGGTPGKFQIGDSHMSAMTKWEGAALITNTLVTGPQNYSVNDRWRLSRDHNLLTIRRQIQGPTVDTEALLVYRSQNAKEPAANKPGETPAPSNGAAAPSDDITVPAGTKIPLALINSLNTKHAAEGDPVYLETSFPVVIAGRIIIPRGSYVIGTVTESKRPGKVKGKGEIFIRFDSLTLPNGVTRSFRARVGGTDAGDFDRQEGKIRGEGDKAGDARRVGETTAAGTSVGAIAGAAAGHAGMGAGIGAAGGAAAGLASVLLSRGPDLILPKGTTFEMVIDRGLMYKPAELGH